MFIQNENQNDLFYAYLIVVPKHNYYRESFSVYISFCELFGECLVSIKKNTLWQISSESLILMLSMKQS